MHYIMKTLSEQLHKMRGIRELPGVRVPVREFACVPTVRMTGIDTDIPARFSIIKRWRSREYSREK
jgi:hypothetical protein